MTVGATPAARSLPPGYLVREVQSHDDLERLTALIHRAYAPHAEKGLRYWGTHQTVEDTAKRLAMGWGLIMLDVREQYVATCTVRRHQPESPVPLYRDPGVVSLSQFCVAPECKGLGLGRLLHDHALSLAKRVGAHTLALDTAAPAKALIAMYEGWGYQLAGECDWRPHTNYPSVLMVHALAG